MKRLLYAVAALLCACGLSIPVSAQLTTITATSIKMGGSPIATGTVTFTPVNVNGVPIPFVQGGGGLNAAQALSCNIVNGAITGTCQIPDSVFTQPANILYSIQITSASSPRAIIIPPVANITGNTWALDLYAPPAVTTNQQPIQLSYGTAAPPISCNSPSFYIRNNAGGQLYMCVANTPVLMTGTGGGAISASTLRTVISTLPGCSTAGNAWNPATNTCEAASAGAQGPQGPAGPTGPQGLKGDQGDLGPIGPTGPAGAAGATGPTGATGAQGPTGAAGAQGPKGDTGNTGPQGPSGGSTNWRGTWSSATAYVLYDAIAYNGSSYIAVASNTNVTPGTDGTKWQLLAQAGGTGATGATGTTGSQGPQGNTGATGSPGTAATVGVGTVATGAAGSSVSVTNSGTSSAAVLNFVIPKGDTGATGSQGPAGATGATGAPGPQGATGPTGPTGATGPSGTTCPVTGVLYSDGTTCSAATPAQVSSALADATKNSQLTFQQATGGSDAAIATPTAGKGYLAWKNNELEASYNGGAFSKVLRALDSITGGQLPSFTGDVSNSSAAMTVTGLNGTLLSSLGAGLLKINGSGVPAKVVASDITSLISTLSGCSTATYVYVPQSGTCVAPASGGSMTYPAAGVANSTGSAWGTSYSVAGAGAGLTTGPIASTVANDIVTMNGTNGQIKDSGTLLSALATLASPALTGVPTAPTAANGTNTTQIATTAFVLANAGSGSSAPTCLINQLTFYAAAGSTPSCLPNTTMDGVLYSFGNSGTFGGFTVNTQAGPFSIGTYGTVNMGNIGAIAGIGALGWAGVGVTQGSYKSASLTATLPAQTLVGSGFEPTGTSLYEIDCAVRASASASGVLTLSYGWTDAGGTARTANPIVNSTGTTVTTFSSLALTTGFQQIAPMVIESNTTAPITVATTLVSGTATYTLNCVATLYN